MKRFISVFVSLIMLVGLFTTVGYATPNSQLSKISSKGTNMTPREFSDKYVTSERVDLLRTSTSYRGGESAPVIDIVSVTVNDGNLVFVADVTEGDIATQLVASGPLYRSYVQQAGTNSIIGALQDENQNFKVIYFNIFNDNVDALFYCDGSWYMKPHLKVYLEDSSGNLLLFETEIPQALSDIVCDGEFAPAHLDCLWFLPYVPYTITEDASKSGINTNTRASWQAWYFPEITLTTTLNGLAYYNVSQPRLDYKINDVVSDGTWYFNFEIDHCATTVNGQTFTHTSDINYTDIVVYIGAGPHTTLDGYLIDADGTKTGIVPTSFSTGTGLALDIAALTAAACGLAIPTPITAGASILAVLADTALDSTRINLGSAVTLSAANTVGLAVQLPDNCLLSSLGDDPDYFRTHVTVSFDDFDEAITETTATMYFKCTFKYGGYYTPTLYSGGHVNAVQVSYVTKAN